MFIIKGRKPAVYAQLSWYVIFILFYLLEGFKHYVLKLSFAMDFPRIKVENGTKTCVNMSPAPLIYIEKNVLGNVYV